MNFEDDLRELLAEFGQRDMVGLTLDSDLVNELGLDSLAGLRLLARVEKRFQVRFPDHRLAEFRTMRQIIQLVEEQRSL